MDCNHEETEEILALPGVIICTACGALFDVYDEENLPSLTKPMTAAELDMLLRGVAVGRAYAA